MGAKEFHETVLKRCAQCGGERWTHPTIGHEFVDPDIKEEHELFDLTTKPWQVLTLSAEDFLIGMTDLGKPQEIQIVGAFADSDDRSVRTAHRDIDLPFHRDGIYTKSIADMQDGMYVEKPNVDVVGMYCLRENDTPCYTMLSATESAEKIIESVDLRTGQALVWDNRLWHARQGAVGKRLLIRFWTTVHEPLGELRV